jgi:disulfide bond formation protein DsbB
MIFIFNKVVAMGTIVMQIVFLYLLAYYFVNRKDANDAVLNFLQKFGVKISLVLAFFGAILTLVYSEVVGYPACYLCWIQRGFIYPQIIFLAVAVRMKKRWAIIVSLVLSVLGILVAIYHNWVSLIGNSEKCTAFGNTTSCATRYVYEFGYITIPVMSLTIFLLLTLLLSISLRGRDTITE